MAVALPRLFLFFFLSPSTSLPVSFFSLAFTPRFRRTLRPSSLYRIQPTHNHIYMYAHTYTHTRMKCILCFRSLYVPSFDSSSSFPSRPVFLLPSCPFLSRARGLPYVCPDLKIVRLVPGRGVPNELEIRSQPRTRER